MLMPVAELPSFSLPHAGYAFLAGFDHQAVMVFFVLSGLLVGGSVLREVAVTGQVAIGPYLLRRLVRLCVVLWPAFVLGAACVAVALSLGASRYGILPADTADTMTLPVLICNAAFLQTAACPQFAGNGALWSLFNEAWYYALFPPIAVALLSRQALTRRILLGVAALGALAGLTQAQTTGSPVGPYMLVWGVGVVAAARRRPFLRQPWLAACLFAGASLAVRLAVRRSFAGDHPLLSAGLDLLLASLFANLLLTLRCCPVLRPPPWPRLHTALAGFSFSLYCTHIPVLVLYVTLLVRLTGTGWHMGGPGGTSWLAVGSGLALCIATAWLFAQMTEAHTATIRSRLARVRPVRRQTA